MHLSTYNDPYDTDSVLREQVVYTVFVVVNG